MPEFAFEPHGVFEQLALRKIEVHEKVRFTPPPHRHDHEASHAIA
jgi:hypothetical protein